MLGGANQKIAYLLANIDVLKNKINWCELMDVSINLAKFSKLNFDPYIMEINHVESFSS